MELFDAAVERVLALTGGRPEPRKTTIGFYANRAYAYVLRRRFQGGVLLTLCLRRHADDPCIWNVVEPYPGRFTTHIVLKSMDEWDESVDALLMEAYVTCGLGK